MSSTLVLSTLLYSLSTHDCAPVDASNSIIKLAEDTTVLSLISNDDEMAYREDIKHLACDVLTTTCLSTPRKPNSVVWINGRPKGATRLSRSITYIKDVIYEGWKAWSRSCLTPPVHSSSFWEVLQEPLLLFQQSKEKLVPPKHLKLLPVMLISNTLHLHIMPLVCSPENNSACQLFVDETVCGTF